MDMDIKCELASNIVDYIWYSVKHRDNLLVEHHSYEFNGELKYHEEAQDIFNQVLDIIDGTIKE